MKLLLAVKSCAQDVAIGANQAIRETWIPYELPKEGGVASQIISRFFIGYVKMETAMDEIHLPCGDGYYALPEKTREILKWALARSFDFIFIADTDTWVNPAKLLACDFEKYDLTGLISGVIGKPRSHQGYWGWPSGGAGYILSARAAQIVVDSLPTGDWAEDKMIGQILGPYFAHETLTAYNCPGFHVPGGISLHCEARANRKDYSPEWMYECEKKWGKR